MKAKDLKAGELYAVRRQYHPCLLLSTDVHQRQRYTWTSKPDEYTPAPTGTKPRQSSSFASPTEYGYVTLTGDRETLAKLDPAQALADIAGDGYRSKLPEGVSIVFVTSTAAFLGRFEEHVKAELRRLAAANERRDLEGQRRRERVERHNAVVRRFNAALGGDVINLVPPVAYNGPLGVMLPFDVAERIAELLATPTHEPEGH